MKYIKIYEDYLDQEEQIQNNITIKYGLKKIIDNIKKPEETYEDYFDNIAKELDVKISKLLAFGGNGVALELNDNRILKITMDKAEVLNSFSLLNKRNLHIVSISNVKILKNDNIFLGVITMSKLKNLNFNQISFINRVKNIIYYNNRNNSAIIWKIWLNKNKQKVLDELSTYDKISITDKNYIIDNMLLILDELNKNNIPCTDLLGNNIGINIDGSLAIFDLGVETYQNIKMLNKIPMLFV